MPWHIENDNPDCSGFAVVKDDDGSVAGCHETKAEAMAQMAALYAKEPMMSDTPDAETRLDPPPRDDLYRAMPGGVTSPDGKTLTIRLAPADTWAEIHSVTEGHFMERFGHSAYRKTMAEQKPKILFQHGKDPEVGEKPISTTDEVGEDEVSPYARGEILDGVPTLVVDGLRKGVYGASHRFSVVREDWDPKPKGGPHNPDRLPERTIKEARLYELGPVTWPAYADASAALRSITDQMRGVQPSDPVAPSLDAEAEAPHLEPERRDEPVVVAAPQPEEHRNMEQYVTREEKASRVSELKEALARQAIEYPGVLPPEAAAQWKADEDEIVRLQADITAWDERQEKLRQFAADPKMVESPTYTPVASFVRKTEGDIYDPASWEGLGSPERRGQAMRDNAMRAVEIASYPQTTNPDQARSQAQRYLDTIDAPSPQNPNHELARRMLATGNPVYRRAFNKYVQGRPLTAEEVRGTALAVEVDGTGGFALPFAFDPTIIPIGSHTGWQNPYRQFCRVETIVGTDTWQGLTSTAVVATRADEAAAATEQGPTFAQPSALVTRVQGAVTYSIEMGQDRPDIGSELAVLIAEAKDNEEESVFSTGIGDALGSKVNPLGIFAAHGTVGAYTHIDLAAAHTLAIGDLDNLEAAVPVRHRVQAVWLMNERILRSVQGLETTGGRLFNGGQYPAVGPVGFNSTGNTGLRLLNKPVYITPSATYDVTVDDTPLIWLGAGNSYLVLDRAGINVEYIPHVFNDAAGSLPTGQRRLYFWYRNTGKPINTDGGRMLFVKNA